MKALPGFGMAMVARFAQRAAMIRAAGVVAVAALVLCGSGPATAQTITEFPIPTAASIPIGMTVGPDGALWFVEGKGNKIGRLTAGGAITEYPLPAANSSPGCIVAGPDGALWFTEGQGNKIGRITTAGVITEFPSFAGGSPECLAVGPDGALWIADQGPTAQGPTGSLVTTGDGWVGRMTTAGVLTKFPLPTPDSHPLGIIRGPDDALWFTMPAANRIGRITTAGAVTEYTVPTPNSSPGIIIPGPDGAMWFTEYLASKIGRITTSGAFSEFPLPAGTNPFAIIPGPDGALWFTEPGIYTSLATGAPVGFGSAGQFIGGGQKIGRMTTSGTVTEFVIPTANSNPIGMTVGPDGVMWFGEVTGNNIGRLTLPPGTPAGGYRYAISDFKVVRNGSTFFEDKFGDGNPPPAAPNSPDGSASSYGGKGSFGPETGNKLTISSTGLTNSDDPSRLSQKAVLKTDTSIDPNKGLKSTQTFSVTGLFDLVVPQTDAEWYFVEFQDSTSTIEGTESLKVGVRRVSSSSVAVMFIRKNPITFQSTVIDQRNLDPNHNQIQLVLTKASATSNAISASFAYVDNGVVGTPTTFANTTTIFNANSFTRAAFGASTPVVSLPAPSPTTPLPPPQTAQTVYTVPSGQMPAAAVEVSATGTFGSASLSVTLDIVQALQTTPATGFAASTYNVYVAALVPGAVVGAAGPAWYVKAQALGWSPLQSPIAAFLENVAQDAANNRVLIEILTNNDITSLVGTEIYIGYGTSDTEMLAAGRYRGIYKAQ